MTAKVQKKPTLRFYYPLDIDVEHFILAFKLFYVDSVVKKHHYTDALYII
ncbi:hypothetical protein [Fusibacter ferrireducens]|uniref:Transposase n=1 Tax=Fusibacter ferrireducens TaxID=2785058 RepID=A0ABR9ZU73_9FIRM|nr:hypothetical protein [Fusibacter ferrireducens]MBF4693435.1 hypothetical protein [Fusibacter ferrireducens]